MIAITDGKKMRSKLDPRGRTGIFVGYADDHAGNVYRFINTQTKKIILSRDVQWLNSFWKEYKTRKDDSRNLVDVFHSLEEDEQTQEESEVEEPNELEIAETNDGNNTEEQKRLGIDIQMIGARKEELGRTRSQTREMMSPRNESMERAELTMEDWIQETCFISAVTSGPTEPKTFGCQSQVFFVLQCCYHRLFLLFLVHLVPPLHFPLGSVHLLQVNEIHPPSFLNHPFLSYI